MPPRKLRILEGKLPPMVRVCELCNMQFTSTGPDPEQAVWDIKANFDVHRCKPGAVSQTAATVLAKNAHEITPTSIENVVDYQTK